MLRKIATFASALGTVGYLSVAGMATNIVLTDSTIPADASSLKKSNGWGSSEHFGPRSGAFSPALTLASDFRELSGSSAA